MTVTTRIIPALDGNPHPLGRHVEHDDRSRDFPYTATVTAPRSVLWQHHGPVLDQGQIGSCTGNATEQSLATGPLYRPGFAPSEQQALRIYELATHLDSVPGSYPPTDTGSSGVGAAKAAKKLGLIGSYSHAFGIDHAKATIQTTPFMVGTVWMEGMFTPDADGTVHPTGDVAGGHEYEVFGHDLDKDLWTCLQSWGTWGVPIPGYVPTGAFHITGPDFANLLAQQGDVTILHR